jgi:hypothetical protein
MHLDGSRWQRQGPLAMRGRWRSRVRQAAAVVAHQCVLIGAVNFSLPPLLIAFTSLHCTPDVMESLVRLDRHKPLSQSDDNYNLVQAYIQHNLF